VVASRSQLEQVVLNLAVNARDAMPRGGRLSIEISDVDVKGDADGVADGRYVLLEVRDQGTGMDPAVREHIFEPFFTTKEAGRGTGFGLATVLAIVKSCGGHIQVDSELGRGTTFRVYLPRTETDPVASVNPPRSPGVGGLETILLVEDDEQLRVVMRTILERRGYAVLDARSGAVALEILEDCACAVDLLLTDVVMPSMSGHELSQRLAARRPGLRVLYMSGHAEDSLARHGMGERVAILQKPITPDRLLQRIREVLDG
jgi:CheY-like chemotaxis protein